MKTFAIIKPDAVERRAVGAIISQIEAAGFRFCALVQGRWSPGDAFAFYREHEGRPYYHDLVAHMTSGPLIMAVLEGPDAVARWRMIMGPTNPSMWGAGTVRGLYGESIMRNAVHGSDSPESADREIQWFERAWS